MPRINASGSVGVRVVGLNELNRAMRTLGPGLQKDLKAANLDVAKMVATHAKGNAESLGGVAAKTAPSIKASARLTAAGVSLGGGGYPFAMGAEFGAYRYHQFKPWRGNGPDAGYFLYPAIRDDADEIVEQYVETIDHLLRKTGLK